MARADRLWRELRDEALERSLGEPVLASFYHASVLNHPSLEAALGYVLAAKLEAGVVPAMLLREVIDEALAADASIGKAVRADLRAHRARDPACESFVEPFLYFKGFHALQAHRVAHWLWQRGRRWLAYLVQNRCSSSFDVDIHPAARIGQGIMIDHGTGLVVGETASIGDDVSILHAVTLGGSGCRGGDRHPKVADGVLISTGAKILGPVRIGEGAKIGAGSVVLADVPPHSTVAGVPARIVGRPRRDRPSLDMDQGLDEEPVSGAR